MVALGPAKWAIRALCVMVFELLDCFAFRSGASVERRQNLPYGSFDRAPDGACHSPSTTPFIQVDIDVVG
jgi:hypothetical protein